LLREQGEGAFEEEFKNDDKVIPCQDSPVA
jgi:hypothetical protein